MPLPPDTSPFTRKVIGLLKQVIANDDGCEMAALTHRLPLLVPGQESPTTFTVCLAPDDRGTFLVTCRELPEITTFGENEEEALAMAEATIATALAERRGVPDLPR